MAKIRVKGDTSGYIDIAAPDVAGAATVNLDKIPQTDQTVNFTSNVGIGTASPSRVLDIVATGSTPPRITGTSNNGGYLDFHNNAATSGRYRIGQGYATATDNIGFLNNEANAPLVLGTNNTERMRIDASGRVTMPYQVGFKASGLVSSPTPPSLIVYNDLSVYGGFNRGGHYSNTTGRFTAPIAGVYLFSANAMGNSNAGRLMLRLVLNSTDAHQGSSSSNGSEYQDSSFTVALYLNANDYVEVKLEGPKGLHGTNPLEYYFSGYLLG